MIFSNIELSELRETLKNKLSKKRYDHTLAVEKSARLLAAVFMPEKISEISAAALLHDVAKELSENEQLRLISESGYELSDDEKASPAIWHAYAAPACVRNNFPNFATDDVLSAVFNHTVGDPNMSLFDEIIFVADFIEETRKHEACKKVRASLIDGLNGNDTRVLHRAVCDIISGTVAHLAATAKIVSPKTQFTLNSFLDKI